MYVCVCVCLCACFLFPVSECMFLPPEVPFVRSCLIDLAVINHAGKEKRNATNIKRY